MKRCGATAGVASPPGLRDDIVEVASAEISISSPAKGSSSPIPGVFHAGIDLQRQWWKVPKGAWLARRRSGGTVCPVCFL